VFVKRSWGRLGAAVGGLALLAGGLVSVAAPAQANHEDTPVAGAVSCTSTNNTRWTHEEAEQSAKERANCDSKDGVTFTHYRLYQIAGYYDEDTDVGYGYTSYGKRECTDTQVPTDAGGCRDKTEEELCVDDGGTWDSKVDGGVCYPELTVPEIEPCPDGGFVDGKCIPEAELPVDINCDWDAGEEFVTGEGCVKPIAPIVDEPVQKAPPPPPCWDSTINNCPVGGALRFTAPKYAMVGVPVTMYAYASWRPDANAPSQPTNGTAVIRVDGEDYSGVEFKDGVAEWRFIPETEGMKEFTASGVVFSGLSGANAYIDTAEARTYVLEYDPAAYAKALKKKRVEVGDTYVITDPNQARSYLEDRYEWSVSEKSDDVCAVYETKKGAVKAKFNGEGKCTVIWMDKESEEEGKYTFIAKK
jgi:hypothetical protein